MDIVTNHTADVIQLEGNAGYRSKAAFPYRDVAGEPFDDSRLRLLGPARLLVPRGRPGVVPVPAGRAGRRGGQQEPGVAERPAALPQPRQHQLLRRELALRRLLRPRRPVDRAPRGGRGHGRHLLVLDRGVRCRRLPHRHHQAREHGVLAELRAGDPGRGRGPRHRRVLRLRRGVRPAVRVAVHERVLHPRAAPGDHRLRLPAGGARLRLPGHGHRRAAGLLRLRRLVHRRRQQRLRHADVPREPRHGPDRALPPAGGPARRGRRRAAGPVAAGARPDVLRPRPAGGLLRRRAGVHRRRRRQGRPGGHVRQRGAGVRRQRPHRHGRDHLGRQLRPRPPALPDDRPLRQPLRAPPRAPVGRPDPPVQQRRPRRVRLLAHRPRRAGRVRRRPQQQRGARLGGRADLLPCGGVVPPPVAAAHLRPGGARGRPDRFRRLPAGHRAAARARDLQGQGGDAGERRGAGHRHHQPGARRHRRARHQLVGRARSSTASRSPRRSTPTRTPR